MAASLEAEAGLLVCQNRAGRRVSLLYCARLGARHVHRLRDSDVRAAGDFDSAFVCPARLEDRCGARHVHHESGYGAFHLSGQCWVGNKIIGGDLTWEATEKAARGIVKLDFSGFLHLGGDLIASFFIGGFLLAAVCTPITYFGVYHLVVRYRRIKAALKAKRVAQKAEKTKAE